MKGIRRPFGSARVAAVMALVWCSPDPLGAQSVLRGTVQDESGAPVSHSHVALLVQDRTVAADAVDVDGRFSIEIPDGFVASRSRLVVSALGYQEYVSDRAPEGPLEITLIAHPIEVPGVVISGGDGTCLEDGSERAKGRLLEFLRRFSPVPATAHLGGFYEETRSNLTAVPGVGEDPPTIRRTDMSSQRSFSGGPVDPFRRLAREEMATSGLLSPASLMVIPVGAGLRMPDVGGFQSYLLGTSDFWEPAEVAVLSEDSNGTEGTFEYCIRAESGARVRGLITIASDGTYLHWVVDLPDQPDSAGGEAEYFSSVESSHLLPSRSSYWTRRDHRTIQEVSRSYRRWIVGTRAEVRQFMSSFLGDDPPGPAVQ